MCSNGEMTIGSHIAQGLTPLIDLIYPPRCPICGESVAQQGGLCSSCWSELVLPSEPACASCGRPFGSDVISQGSQCAPCLANPPRHAGISAATLYNDPSRRLVLAFKHGGKLGLAPMLARLIAARLPERDEGDPPPLLVPVPLHRWRLWKRGFNQAALLARELEKAGKGELAVDLLIRRKPTPSLGGLGRKARERALKGALAINPRRTGLIANRDVTLVDDVLTSGATSDASVALLLKAGARSVRIACFARVLEEALNAPRTAPALDTETPEVLGTSGAT